jgi:hypothetical protein
MRRRATAENFMLKQTELGREGNELIAVNDTERERERERENRLGEQTEEKWFSSQAHFLSPHTINLIWG